MAPNENSEIRPLPDSEPHEVFLELCARSAAGLLSREERRRLDQHLAVCSSCRQASSEYWAVVKHVVPALGAQELSANVEPGPDWSEERAEAALFERITRAEGHGRGRNKITTGTHLPDDIRALPDFGGQKVWNRVWALYAAAVVLLFALGFSAYRVGIHRGVTSTQAVPPAASTPDPSALEAELSDAGHERELARAQIEQRERQIRELRRQLQRQAGEMDEMQLAQSRLDNELRTGQRDRQDLTAQSTALAEKLVSAQAASQAIEQQLGTLQQETSEDTQRAKTLETKVTDLTKALAERDATVEQQQQLLAHDRDIRELMGARDLYIAEVYDVARTGVTRKPYGRVFYTKGKSLLFYAYDLDQEEGGLKNVSTFQVWGRRGTDQKQALSLGIFYVDSAASRRWVLKVDDPKMLAAIDAVFVTVEPSGGSRRPSGKSLLFAYLKVDPNHP